MDGSIIEHIPVLAETLTGQIDLPPDRKSGLVEAAEILTDTEGIAFVHLTKRDVVRHKLVQDIIGAYEVQEKNDLSRRRSGSADDDCGADRR